MLSSVLSAPSPSNRVFYAMVSSQYLSVALHLQDLDSAAVTGV